MDKDDPTRPLPPLTPRPGGIWDAHSVLSSPEFRLSGLGLVPSDSVIPVIVVPGIMGTNVRAKFKPRLGRIPDERNEVLAPGQPAWRPPNSTPGGLAEATKWLGRTAETRQKIFNAPTLEVDDRGPPHIPHGDGRLHVNPGEARQRGWGEVHADSYIGLLCGLQTRLNQTFWQESPEDERHVLQHWKDVMACDPRKWGAPNMEPLTEAALEKHARHQYPVYAVGYNWLQSCAESSKRLEDQIHKIIDSWKKMGRQCDKVIIVTHSMGGLVTRACAKRIPDKIAGVIHGVMPALGAPVCYRRMACGMESDNIEEAVLGTIAGPSSAHTTPVMGLSPGPLELLPNHLYPGQWLHASIKQRGLAGRPDTTVDYVSLPNGTVTNVYDIYRDLKSWYKAIDPAWIHEDAYSEASGDVEGVIRESINAAERFHRWLGDEYHSTTFSFYGNDTQHLSFGRVRWLAQAQPGISLTTANVGKGMLLAETGDSKGGKYVSIDGRVFHFEPEQQDSPGDGTVPYQSGAGPAGKVKQIFETRGYSHQGAFNDELMLKLTLRLVVKIVEGMS